METDNVPGQRTRALSTPVDHIEEDDHHDDIELPSLITKTPTTSTATIKTKQQQPQQSQTPDAITTRMEEFLFILIFVTRYIILLATLTLLVIAVLYTIGSIVTLNADNLFCPAYSEQDVRKYNYENNLAEGDADSCYYIDRQRLNFNDIKNLNLNIFEASFLKISDLTIDTMMRFLFYSIICVCLFGIIVYQSYFLIYDTIFLLLRQTNCCYNCCNYNDSDNSRNKINLKTKSKRRIVFGSKYLNPRVAKAYLACIEQAKSERKSN